jgi:flagellar M-ring protein FliF
VQTFAAAWNALRDQLKSLGPMTQLGLVAGLSLLVAAGVVVATRAGSMGGSYAYVFTNLAGQDGADAEALLASAGIPSRLEANGAALAVPEHRVHDARILLASAGLPRASGYVGFELFDRGELGVSQFTQHVNLRRALEGELGRTLSSMRPVQSARVHITLPERGLFKDDDHQASAAVVVTLKPGAVLTPQEVNGIRHLVSSAIPGGKPQAVKLMDGSGAVLADGNAEETDAFTIQRRVERDLEQRAADVLEPVVGHGLVVVRVSAELDSKLVDSTEERFDPEGAVVRSEHTINVQQNGTGGTRGGVAGSAANQPLAPAAPLSSSQNATQADETRNYELSKTVTRTQRSSPHLARMSVAVLVGGPALSEAAMARLRTLAGGAVGLDATRGDKLELMHSAFVPKEPGTAEEESAQDVAGVTRSPVLVGVVLAVVAAGALAVTMRRRALAARALATRRREEERVLALQKAAEEKKTAELAAAKAPKPMEEWVASLQSKVLADPGRAALVVRAWLAGSTMPDSSEVKHAR